MELPPNPVTAVTETAKSRKGFWAMLVIGLIAVVAEARGSHISNFLMSTVGKLPVVGPGVAWLFGRKAA